MGDFQLAHKWAKITPNNIEPWDPIYRLYSHVIHDASYTNELRSRLQPLNPNNCIKKTVGSADNSHYKNVSFSSNVYFSEKTKKRKRKVKDAFSYRKVKVFPEKISWKT